MLINTIKSSSIFEMDLNLYDGGTGDGAGVSGSSGGSSTGGTGNGTGNTSSDSGNTTPQSREDEINSRIPWHKLKHGKPTQQSSNQGVAQPTSMNNGSNQELANPNTRQTENKNSERWNELINGEFKEDYHNAIKSAIHNRTVSLHQQLDQANENNQQLQNIVEAIRIRYPQATDNESLLAAINGDDGLIEQAAFDEGLSPEQYREKLSEQRQHDLDAEELRMYRQQALQNERNNKIMNQIPEVINKYGNFNMETALENPKFAQILAYQQMSGDDPDIMTAYEIAFHDEIMDQQIKATYNQANRRFTEQQIAGQYLPGTAVNTGMPTQQNLQKQKYEEAKKLIKAGKSAAHLFR